MSVIIIFMCASKKLEQNANGKKHWKCSKVVA
ncbi:hypothetical protein T12_2167 [Trichinella patagoniensis]|uniref:Uncharacterized protein n=1 Tax=Trichinella patagoniensis TaxID=990121 RepID=A0A0V0YS28_9BILA|nr:hypothetical protein T12_2167 [Trichinella patagoniensis]